MHMARTLLCLGYGYTAQALSRRLREKGWRIAATARSAEKAAALKAERIAAFSWDERGLDPAAFERADALLVSTPPGEAGCPAFAAAAGMLAGSAPDLSWIGYLSSNGVYGDHGGDWIDEATPVSPGTDRGSARAEAEARWSALAGDHALPLVIFRLPGIYGPGRSALDAVREGRARRILKEGQVFNRMHVDDIAAALEASIDRPQAGALFNLSDNEPSPPHEVVAYACALLDAETPPLIPLEEADLSEMARSFYAENKRVRNERMKEALGVTLDYPSYREGLRAIHATESAA